MNWSERRKLTYLVVIFLCVAGIGAVVFHRYTNVPPTCFDRKKNGDEVGTDCGGSCKLYCPDELANPKVRWFRSFLVSPGLAHAVVYLEHSNVSAGVRSVPYEFKLYDEKNNIIATRTGQTFIGPFGRTAIVESLIPTGNVVPTTVRFSFTSPIPWEKISPDFSQVVIKTDRRLLESFPGGTRLTVTLENKSRFTFNDLEVVALLYDREDNALAVSKSVVSELLAQSERVMYFTWPDHLVGQVFRVEVIPRFNPFSAQQL